MAPSGVVTTPQWTIFGAGRGRRHCTTTGRGGGGGRGQRTGVGLVQRIRSSITPTASAPITPPIATPRGNLRGARDRHLTRRRAQRRLLRQLQATRNRRHPILGRNGRRPRIHWGSRAAKAFPGSAEAIGEPARRRRRHTVTHRLDRAAAHLRQARHRRRSCSRRADRARATTWRIVGRRLLSLFSMRWTSWIEDLGSTRLDQGRRAEGGSCMMC